MPEMSGLPAAPCWPLTPRPEYTRAMKDLYDPGSLKTLASVRVLFGSMVRSVQLVAVSERSPSAVIATASGFRKLRLDVMAASEANGEARQIRARARIDVVIEAIQSRRGIDAAIARHRECILDGHVSTDGLPMVGHRAPERDVVHAQERRVFDVIVRQILRRLETRLEYGRMQVVWRCARKLGVCPERSEEHTSELQSLRHLV